MVGAGALAAVSTLSGAAGAQTVQLNGAGSSLLAPYWEQTVQCWDQSTLGGSSIYQNGKFAKPGATASATDPLVTTLAAPSCVANVASKYIAFVASGSGAGQAVFFAHDARTDLLGSNPDGTATPVFTGLQYALSDNSLANKDVGVYTVGTNASYTPPDGSGVITTPATYNGKQFGATVALTFGGAAGPNNYAVPASQFGPLVQVPVSIDAVAIAFNPYYKPGKKLLINGGKLQLDAAAYCKIFTGQITDWGDSALTALNQTPTKPASPLVQAGDIGTSPIKIVGRSDSSGTTSIFTRHLAAVCGPLITGSNPYGTAGTTTLPTSVAYDLQSGSGGVATEINANQGAIGYVGVDYVAPFVAKTHAVSFSLPAAKLKNNFGTFELPTPATATAAFVGINPPATSARPDPTQWAQTPSASVALANPTGKTAYPIVGTTQFLAYSCYASTDSVNTLRAFYTFLGSAKGASVLKAAGLAPLNSAWKTAITQTFFTPTATTAPWNLFLATAGTGADGLGDGKTNTNCTAGGIIGG
jgi:ABC-type phosphate transport system substrate-binding protein